MVTTSALEVSIDMPADPATFPPAPRRGLSPPQTPRKTSSRSGPAGPIDHRQRPPAQVILFHDSHQGAERIAAHAARPESVAPYGAGHLFEGSRASRTASVPERSGPHRDVRTRGPHRHVRPDLRHQPRSPPNPKTAPPEIRPRGPHEPRDLHNIRLQRPLHPAL